MRRMALPLWHCISKETKKGLRPFLFNGWEEPECKWAQWKPEGVIFIVDDIDKFMRQRPKHPAGVT